MKQLRDPGVLSAVSIAAMPVTRRTLLGSAASGLATIITSDAYARRADESKVTLASIDRIRPSQGAVGMREVAAKTTDLIERARKPDKLAKFLIKEALPVVVGPGGNLHLIDHHHLGRALWDAKRTQVHVETVADLTPLAPPAFWAEMTRRGYLHPFDENGMRLDVARLPKHVKDLGDDVYRSLAGAVRNAGGYAKSDALFAEFKWADFLRSRIAKPLVQSNFNGALAQAMIIAKASEASALPGFAGQRS
jgi:hypothetical protein